MPGWASEWKDKYPTFQRPERFSLSHMDTFKPSVKSLLFSLILSLMAGSYQFRLVPFHTAKSRIQAGTIPCAGHPKEGKSTHSLERLMCMDHSSGKYFTDEIQRIIVTSHCQNWWCITLTRVPEDPFNWLLESAQNQGSLEVAPLSDAKRNINQNEIVITGPQTTLFHYGRWHINLTLTYEMIAF